jgi:hypothetical protein
MTSEAISAARRSHREADEGRFWTAPLSELAAAVDASQLRLEGLSGAAVSGEVSIAVDNNMRSERNALHNNIQTWRGLLDRVVGSFHVYVAARYQELRFGSAVESAFEVVRRDVDGRIAGLVPGALPMIAAAFENATSTNPEHWANAAATCRRLLKEVADALRPPGPDVVQSSGRTIKMGEGNYVNRLVDWIVQQSTSATARALIQAELEFLGRRLDAADAAGHKGAHDRVSLTDASRYITATYLLLGDVLALQEQDPGAVTLDAADASAPLVVEPDTGTRAAASRATDAVPPPVPPNDTADDHSLP